MGGDSENCIWWCCFVWPLWHLLTNVQTNIQVIMPMSLLSFHPGDVSVPYSWDSVLSDKLTHLPLDKMAAISQTTFSNAFLLWKFWFLIKITPQFVPKGPIDNNPELVKIMAWHRICDKPLSDRNGFYFIPIWLKYILMTAITVNLRWLRQCSAVVQATSRHLIQLLTHTCAIRPRWFKDPTLNPT